jgi:hypothetical protein
VLRKDCRRRRGERLWDIEAMAAVDFAVFLGCLMAAASLEIGRRPGIPRTEQEAFAGGAIAFQLLVSKFAFVLIESAGAVGELAPKAPPADSKPSPKVSMTAAGAGGPPASPEGKTSSLDTELR